MTVDTHRPMADADAAFARFCREHDVTALAEVFDATAPRLILVAVHLAGDEAEDLLQTTFLEAIRNADRFEPGRPVMPWLLAILTRRAANVWRTRLRARRGDVDVATLRDRSPGPGERAASRELEAELAHALEHLDEPYREVLVLRVAHGMLPIEIARVVDRPVGTVYAQLHRGAARLRRVLPKGLAVALAGLLGAGDATAAVRARVLAAAKGSGVPAVGLVFGGVAMKKLIAGGIVAAALLGLGVIARPWSRSGPAAPDGGSVPAHVAATESPPDAGTHAPETLDREAVPTGSGPAAVAPDEIAFVGRTIDATTGAPLAGVSVHVKGFPSVLGRTLPADWTPPCDVESAGDGSFRIVCRTRPEVWLEVYFEADGRVPRFASSEQLRPGITVEVGDVPMVRGTRISMRCVDDDGTPVRGFEFNLEEPAHRKHPGKSETAWWGRGSSSLVSDADGRAGPVTLYPGRWSLSVFPTTSYRLVGRPELDVPCANPPDEIVIRLTTPDPDRCVAGHVVDERGQPVEGVAVMADQPNPPGHHPCLTQAGGAFVAGPYDAKRGPVTIRGLGPESFLTAREFRVIAPTEPVPVGARDVHVVVRRLPRGSLRVEVVDAATHEPVERFRAAAVPVVDHDYAKFRGTILLKRDDGLTGIALDDATQHDRGVESWDELRPGHYLVFVEPEDSALARAFGEPVDVAPGIEASLEIALPRWRRVQVRLRDRQGTPVDGATVELARAVGCTPAVSWFRFAIPLHPDAFDRGVSGTFLHGITDSATTDRDGLAWLRAAPELGEAALRVTGLYAHDDLPPPAGAPAGSSRRAGDVRRRRRPRGGDRRHRSTGGDRPRVRQGPGIGLTVRGRGRTPPCRDADRRAS